MTNEIFAKRLVELREQKNISQQQLADAIGVTRQSLSLYERAERTINIELLAAISKYFGVTSDFLLGLSDVASPDIEDRAICEKIGCSERTLRTLKYIFNPHYYNGEPIVFDKYIVESFFENEIVTSDFIMKLSKATAETAHLLDEEERHEINRKAESTDFEQLLEEREKINQYEGAADGAEWRLMKSVLYIKEKLTKRARDQYTFLDKNITDKDTNEVVSVILWQAL